MKKLNTFHHEFMDSLQSETSFHQQNGFDKKSARAIKEVSSANDGIGYFNGNTMVEFLFRKSGLSIEQLKALSFASDEDYQEFYQLSGGEITNWFFLKGVTRESYKDLLQTNPQEILKHMQAIMNKLDINEVTE